MRVSNKSSLSVRLLAIAVLSILAAVSATGFAIGFLFEFYFEDQLRSDLASELDMLTDRISLSDKGDLLVQPMADIRYSEPLSGMYWQVEAEGKEAKYSRSLWDQGLPEITLDAAGRAVSSREVLADGEILALAWKVQLTDGSKPLDVVLTVAKSMTDFKESVSKFNTNIALWLALLGVALILASWVQVRLGLRPLESIRGEIRKLAKSNTARLSNEFPKEVQPLVDEVNSMMDLQDRSLRKARHSAGNLAHGLKTPLTILVGLVEKLKTIEEPELAEDLSLQITKMNAIVERELARARSDQGMRSRANAMTVAKKIITTMQHMPRGAQIKWEVILDENMMMPFDTHDLSELLGNLLDNARKHAKSRVLMSGEQTKQKSVFRVEDDGPGIPDELMVISLNRGETLSWGGSGHGIGLSIVKELANSRNCDLKLSKSELGGLKVEIFF